MNRTPASMEPLFFKAENATAGDITFVEGVLQWSRFFSKRKIDNTVPIVSCVCGCFNGAAFFQSGKYHPHRQRAQHHRELQWSRFFSKRKIVPAAEQDAVKVLLASMEPLFFKAENLRKRVQALSPSVALQWSRFFSKRKINLDPDSFP